MNGDKAPLDHLRIDRDARSPSRLPVGLLLGLLLAGVLIGGAFWWMSRSGKALVMETTVARQQAIGTGGQKTLLNASGYVTARRSATVSSKITGKVVEVMVEEGMKVENGQLLARLDSTNVEAGLRLAEAQLESTRTALEETKPNLAFAQRELQRFNDLAARKVVSDSDLRRAEMDARTLEARLSRQTAELGVRQSEIGQWKQQLDDTVIRAPFSGVVTSKNAQPGEMISPMSVGGFTRTGICTIVDMTSLEIEVDVNESYINRVRPGQPVEAALDAYSNWKIPAKVIAIIPTADRQKATVRVRVGFDALDPRILPEMGVKVSFQEANGDTSGTRAGILLPAAAVGEEGGRHRVWVVRDGRVERRAVTAEKTQTNEFMIIAGLNDGERLILNAPRELADGSRVTEKTR